ncbi:LacI family DNA-binding transcriptional regulator [Microbacterium marinilacus]|uniref:LacI family DNA-binding transcriptional regulator n=1 Tax=Microbacterium marinilacus TaxID=415209 RepID=A0ABP7BV29_9MICO|nr:LacI family DNA-binding transcriptional regulator [Microbacterium marinilacus]MBY0689093.1 LacI family transcriptional regulator [Microbacterium marinilacus]
MTRAVTIRHVAEEARVSIATVSNTMNRPSRVAAETRGRVLEAADRLGYVPHAAANANTPRARRKLGIIAPFRAYPSYGMRLNGILEVFGADRTDVVVFDHPSASRSPSPRLAALPFSGGLDGLVIMGVPVDTGLGERILDRELPIVLIDSTHPRFSSVVLDEARGTDLAAEHLIARGFERFVYVTEGQLSNDYISQGKRRLSGFLRALAARGISDDRVQRLTARSGDVAAGRIAADVIATISRDGRVGVLAGHDTLAAGILAGLRETGRGVPDRIGVMGWDGGDLVEALGLTTVHQPLVESGRLGAERLMALMRDGTSPLERVLLAPTLVTGVTT